MRTYGVSVSDILANIRENRNAIAFWNGYKGTVSDVKRAEIVKSHTDNVRDLRIILAMVRFPEMPTDAFRFGADFVPFIITDSADVSEDNKESENAISDSDAAAFADAIADSVAEMTGETVNA